MTSNDPNFQGANATLCLKCPCGFVSYVNMSGGSEKGHQFDDLLIRNIEINSLKTAEVNKMFTGLNMRAENHNGHVTGINLETSKMSKIRNNLHSEIIMKKNKLEDQMLSEVVEQDEMPEFSFDAQYSHRLVLSQSPYIFYL